MPSCIQNPTLVLLAILSLLDCIGCGNNSSPTFKLPSGNGELTELILRERAIEDADLQQVSQQSSLEALEIYRCDFGHDGIVRISELIHLRRLRLEDFPADDRDVRRLSALVKLEVLNLPNANFSDAGLQHLAGMPNLQLLRFGSPRVTDAGLKFVADMPKLRFLHLLNVPISDSGLSFLHGNTRLESFYLDGGNATDEGLSRLIKALPDLHFHRDQLHLPEDPKTGHPD